MDIMVSLVNHVCGGLALSLVSTVLWLDGLVPWLRNRLSYHLLLLHACLLELMVFWRLEHHLRLWLAHCLSQLHCAHLCVLNHLPWQPLLHRHQLLHQRCQRRLEPLVGLECHLPDPDWHQYSQPHLHCCVRWLGLPG